MKSITEEARRKGHSCFKVNEIPTEDTEMPKSSPTATAVFTITALVLTNVFALTSAMGLPVGF